MTPLALAMDGLLAALLLAAVLTGVRLNGRLKALRESQAGFAQAVSELDGAAMRAEAALASLRQGGEESHDALLNRIETARSLLARLETATEKAEAAARRAESVPAAVQPVLRSQALADVQAPSELRRTLDSLRAARASAAGRSDVQRELAERVDPAEPSARTLLARRRQLADEDLFAEPSVGRGGRR